MGSKDFRKWFAATVVMTAALASAADAARAQAPSNRSNGQPCCAGKASTMQDGRASKRAAAAARFGASVDALLAPAPESKGEWGLLVEDAQSGEILFERNPDSYFVPASNMKLFTTALALAKLGPDYRFHTTLETRGMISAGGILRGDVLLIGRGDPNLSNRKFPYELKEEFDGLPEKVLAELADALVARGVREITGDIIGDDSYFPRERYSNGWEIGDMVWEYGAAISAIVVDDNTVTATLTPGERPGDPVLATVAPLTRDFALQNDVTTSAADAKSDLTLTREPGANLVVVRGTLPAKSAPRKLVLAIEEPAQHAATLLAGLLSERGVKIDGKTRAVHVPDTDVTPQTVLAEHVSVPLAEAVKLINKISQNLHTEMLLRTVARQNGLWTTPEDLFKPAQDFYASVGIGLDDVIQTDGSGLSRHDLVTPRAIVTLLKYAQTQPWFDTYYASLPIAGVDGSLQDRMKNTPASGRIHAKTGSVEHVRSLSGYAETPNGRRLIFSFLSNNQGGKAHEAADALNGFCTAMVEEFDEPAAAAAGGAVRKR
ncbi:MAG TPA: D-alanyl-D-alanine carboxypeptidase/D-alanyl-D-alanine-endopeptidase [Candidatus Methylomirabilis sp.]|nr:D-alanyl-D-alanine carboxypeptidase/D-alanyl-D-alanine-endopeptidase [Candidatus Methylomirabilis sp.]